MQPAQTWQTPAQGTQALPSQLTNQVYWTPETQAVARDNTVKKRVMEHRFYNKFLIQTCAITNKSSMAAPSLVEFAHMKPHKDTHERDDMNRWAWMMGHAYRGTFHIDCRLNIMPLNVYIHRLLDSHLVTFLLDENILKIVEEKLLVNSSVKTATERRQRILTDLDKEMPEGGWPVTFMASNKCDKTEAIMVHDMGEDSNGRLHTIETYQVFRHPFEIPFKTAASPIFILANMLELQKNLNVVERPWYETHWKAKQWDLFLRGVALLEDYVEKANVPNYFKRRAGRNTRGSSRGETVFGPPEDKYDYRVGKYEPEKAVAYVARYNSENSDNEHHTDSEEENDLDKKTSLKDKVDTWSGLDFFLRDSQLPAKNLFQTAKSPGSSSDANDERDDRPLESPDPFSRDEMGSSRSSDPGPPESSELFSDYVDDETGSEIGRRDSPLRLRSRLQIL